MLLEKYVSGHKEKGVGYTYFVPNPINFQWEWQTPEINELLEKASVKLGELNSYARLVPNINLFMELHITKEAVVSSSIEGTQTNMDEALLPEEEVKPERRHDWREVHNYIEALNHAIAELKTLPVSSRLLKTTHKVLLRNVRGEHKLPGEYRTSQNWIGGSSIADATFIPPHHKYVNELMGDLENFLHNYKIVVPKLIRIGMAHYQFETIHPFLDGNGRIGRLLISLYLVNEKILDKPLLYLSGYFEKNKNLYYDNLTRVRDNNAFIQWLKYFLVGIEQTATEAVETLSQVIQLRQKTETQLLELLGRRSHSGMLLLQYLFQHPVISSTEQVVKACNLSKKAANDLIAAFATHKIIREITGQSRNRIFVFEDYIRLFR